MQDSDDSNEHQQQSPPRPKTSKKLTGAATYRTKFSSIWVSHCRVLFEVERSAYGKLAQCHQAHFRVPRVGRGMRLGHYQVQRLFWIAMLLSGLATI